MHSTISMGQVGLAFSRRQQCLFKIKIGTFKEIEVWSSQELKRTYQKELIKGERCSHNEFCMLFSVNDFMYSIAWKMFGIV